MSKIPPQEMTDAIKTILDPANRKKRKFKESIDLQVNLKNYDVTRDKRFAGSLRLPHVCRPRMKVAVICDLQHEDVAKKAGMITMNMEDMKKLNKNKKLVKKLCAQYDAFLASESIIKTLPRVVGPHMNRAGKFPAAVALSDNLVDRVMEIQSTVKFQLKKVLCLGTCVGHAEADPEEVRRNTNQAINFLVSLLKKNWQNMKSVYIKTTMGKPVRLY
jgi:large subunit ribosomal protein L10Ae